MSTKKVESYKLTESQEKVVKDWEAITGFEFMHLDEVKSGKTLFCDAFSLNANWIGHVAGDAQNLYHGED